MPTRSRSISFEIVDRLHDTEAQVITDAEPGRLYYGRICFDRGVPYTGKIKDPVRTTRPEKCDIFSQRYQSQPITKKFQKTLLIFS